MHALARNSYFKLNPSINGQHRKLWGWKTSLRTYSILSLPTGYAAVSVSDRLKNHPYKRNTTLSMNSPNTTPD